ncbi:MAG: response regulator transcription factor [Mesorhizobium sp.]|nr:MAG: response regulator transcription factor [Mesorhizobium sp.]
MIVIVDERELVTEGYSSLFDREGVATAGFAPGEFGEWVNSAADTDLRSVRAFLIGDCREGAISPRQIRDRTGAPVIALSEQHSLEHTLRLFESGVDDVVRKPVHIREILARITAIRRRAREEAAYTEVGSMRIFMAIYGIFDEEVEENVVESHISKLRKKLREKLGHDPIDSKRFLGYRLVF